MKNYCEKCKKEIDDLEAKFCPDCGTPLSQRLLDSPEISMGSNKEEIFKDIKEQVMVKYCEKCKKEIDDLEAKFCPDCGSTLIDRTLADNEEKDFATESPKLVFCKQKMIARLVYKTIYSEVEISFYDLSIKQRIERFIIPDREQEKKILFSEIQKAEIKTKIDFWDALYAIVFGILGFMNPALFLVTVVCLYTGYGKNLVMKMQNGEEFSIPFRGEIEEAEKVLTIINSKIGVQ